MSARSRHPSRSRPSRPRDGELRSAAHPKAVLRQLELSPRKSMGQNFLVSAEILARIVELARVKAGETVLEIGPGLGALTRHLRATGANVVALEKDRGYAAFLQEQFASDPGVEIVQGDALEWDFGALPVDRPVRVVANLPYNVAVPILFRLLEQSGRFTDLHVMVQKEVAERMEAGPGTAAYGALTVNLGVKAEVVQVLEVPRGAFYPAPKVLSAVVRIVPRAASPFPFGDAAVFAQVVRAAFGERRKTMRNALSAGFGRERAEAALEKAGVDGMRRGETLSIEEFCRLSLVLSEEEPAAGEPAGPRSET